MADTAPMWFNAHCHLELSHLRGAIPQGLGFVDWLERIVVLKRRGDRAQQVGAIRAALSELALHHTAGVMDIDSMGVAPQVLAESGMPCVVFNEMIEFDPDRAHAMIDQVAQRQQAVDLAAWQRYGLSPHAVYTTTPALLIATHAAASRAHQWMCLHVAETSEETDFLVSGRGPLAEFLGDAGVLPDDWKPPGVRPIPYLARLGMLGPRTLLVHLNEVDDNDLAIIARSRARAVVCPGTHAYFGRGAFPLSRLLGAGIRCYLGTDSLASNEALDMDREVDVAIQLAPDVDPDRIRRMAEWSFENVGDFLPQAFS